MSAPKTMTSPINAAHEVLMRAVDNALCVDDVATAAGLKKRDAAKQLKELNGLGLIEAEPRAGGVPFYRLIVAPASNINDMPEVGDMNVVELSRALHCNGIPPGRNRRQRSGLLGLQRRQARRLQQCRLRPIAGHRTRRPPCGSPEAIPTSLWPTSPARHAARATPERQGLRWKAAST